MKLSTKLFSLATALFCGVQSISAQLPTIEVPVPTHPETEVLSFFSPMYTPVSEFTDMGPTWGSKSSYAFRLYGEYSSVMEITGLDTSWGLAIRLDPQVRFIDHRYLHIDVFCNEATPFRVGFHRHYPDDMEVYFPVMDITPGEWNSFDIELSTLPNYGGDALAGEFGNVINYLRFGNQEKEYAYANKIYVANMYIHTPFDSAIDKVENNSSINLYPTLVKEAFTCEAEQAIESVDLYDVTGKLVDTYIVGGLKKEVNISSIGTGYYIAAVKMLSGEVISKRIIKQ